MPTSAELSAALDSLVAAVAARNTVDASGITLMTGLKAQLDAALASGGTPQEIIDQVTALSADMGTRAQEMTDAISLNTPASVVP